MLNFRSINNCRNLSIALVALGAIASIFCSARAEAPYPFDMKKKYPKAFAAYQKMVPAKYHKVAWIYSLDATAGPMSSFRSGGKKCLIGSVCQPHDCGGNQFAFVVAVNGSSAVGLLRSENLTKGKEVIFGKPDATQLGLLKKQINQE
ncbi:MAG: Ivy family c-type lysozyme inhibitor [Candidatus Obscuribacterales bacterium]